MDVPSSEELKWGYVQPYLEKADPAQGMVVGLNDLPVSFPIQTFL